MKSFRQKISRRIKSEDFFPYRLKAAYTVEVAAVMGICMIFMGMLFMGGIGLYRSSMETVESYERTDTKPQELFRLTRAVKGIADESGLVSKSEVENGD